MVIDGGKSLENCFLQIPVMYRHRSRGEGFEKGRQLRLFDMWNKEQNVLLALWL